MNATPLSNRPRRIAGGIAAAVLGCAGLLSAPTATASQVVDGGGLPRCDLTLWYVVHNPSIAKPRGDQAEPVHRIVPSGPCPR